MWPFRRLPMKARYAHVLQSNQRDYRQYFMDISLHSFNQMIRERSLFTAGAGRGKSENRVYSKFAPPLGTHALRFCPPRILGSCALKFCPPPSPLASIY